VADPDDALVRTADIEVRELTTGADLELAVAMLDTQELVVGIPLVDEGERRRLEAATGADEARSAVGEASSSDAGARDPRWRPIVACRDEEVVGYAGIVLPPDREGVAVGDLAPARLPGAWAGIAPALLNGLEAVIGTDAAGLQVWVRHVAMGDLAPAVAAGYRVDRRLGVLGRTLAEEPVPTPPPGIVVRAYGGDDDDVEVVEVLATAYEGTGDGGWDLDRFRARRELPWFRAQDLLLAVDADGRLGGLHWLKRRDALTGEVYNLAVHPRAQGKGLGPVLLGAGLAHLREIGCTDVILWVDRANERAVSLYTRHGFETRWDDVALHHELPHAAGGSGVT
jgi:mycothiol synthase